MTAVSWIARVCICFTLLFQGHLGLRDISLSIEPAVVQRFQHAVLHCRYDLENSPLYSVKWYRGPFEFYRYTPSEHPSTKVFPIGGISVDVNYSNSTQVVLRNIEFNLSGNFSCEVTTDEIFATKTALKAMLVVQFPEHPPTISVGHIPLDYGDMLKANCSSPPSRPPALLRFSLNNITVARSEPLSQRQSLEHAWSDLSLELPLSEFHFAGGRLLLRCVAQVADTYQQDAELELPSARQPVPERVSAVDSANSLSTYIMVQLIAFNSMLLIIS